MHIACLGWGSLVWDPRNLPVRGEWQQDGPPLPVEFVRQSSDGRLTLAIFEDVTDVTTLWVEVSKNSLDEAVKNLGEREGNPSKNRGRHIGVWREDVEYRDGGIKFRIGQWAVERDIDAVIWTALPPKFDGEDERAPTVAEAAGYLSGLEGEIRKRAEEYVRRAPPQIRTEYRQRFERELGWYSLDKSTRGD